MQFQTEYMPVSYTHLDVYKRQAITGYYEGNDINYETDNKCAISMAIATIIPNREWHTTPKVCISGMASPNRKLDRKLINEQFVFRVFLKSETPQVYMHEVVTHFQTSEEPRIFGTCIWSKIDGVITGATHFADATCVQTTMLR